MNNHVFKKVLDIYGIQENDFLEYERRMYISDCCHLRIPQRCTPHEFKIYAHAQLYDTLKRHSRWYKTEVKMILLESKHRKEGNCSKEWDEVIDYFRSIDRRLYRWDNMVHNPISRAR